MFKVHDIIELETYGVVIDQFIPSGWASQVKPDCSSLQISHQKIESNLSLFRSCCFHIYDFLKF